MSDLHVDVSNAAPIPALAEGVKLVVVAGDTCQGLAVAAEVLRAAFPDVDVVMVGGNHEFYGFAFAEELEAGRRRPKALGVHLLENASATFGGLTIVGVTLWTDYDLFGEPIRLAAIRAAADVMRDHKKIK